MESPAKWTKTTALCFCSFPIICGKYCFQRLVCNTNVWQLFLQDVSFFGMIAAADQNMFHSLCLSHSCTFHPGCFSTSASSYVHNDYSKSQYSYHRVFFIIGCFKKLNLPLFPLCHCLCNKFIIPWCILLLHSGFPNSFSISISFQLMALFAVLPATSIASTLLCRFKRNTTAY